jgi:hypothetical protein
MIVLLWTVARFGFWEQAGWDSRKNRHDRQPTRHPLRFFVASCRNNACLFKTAPPENMSATGDSPLMCLQKLMETMIFLLFALEQCRSFLGREELNDELAQAGRAANIDKGYVETTLSALVWRDGF